MDRSQHCRVSLNIGKNYAQRGAFDFKGWPNIGSIFGNRVSVSHITHLRVELLAELTRGDVSLLGAQR